MRKDLVDINCERNEETADLQESYAGHREKIMQLVSSTVAELAGRKDGTCSSAILLGSGNCLDVDLPKMAELFKKLHLVDLDETASKAAVEASGVSSEQVQIHAPEDVAEPLLSLTSRDFRPEEDNREHCIKVLQALSSENGVADVPEADMVLSLCLFSQMIDALSRIIDRDHPSFANALKALRIGHLRRMISMLRPGGVAVFVSDVVSSDTAPELKTTDEKTLSDTIKNLVNQRNFLSGTNPAMVLNDLNVLSRLPSGPETVHTIDPWLWDVGQRRYAVYAFRIQKRIPLPVEELPPGDGDELPS